VNIPAPAPVTFLSLGILFAVIVLTVDNQPRLASRRHGAIAIVAALLLVTMTFVVTVSPSDTRVTFPVVDQGGVVLVRDRNAGTVLCLCDTNAKAAARATRAVAALGVNRLDAVVFSGEPEDLPEQLDALFAALSPLRVWIPSECMTGPISGLDDRFQATMGSLSPHQMVQLARADSTIRVGTGSGSEPVLSIAAGLLAGTAGTITSSQTRAPGFTYDIDAGIVAVATPEGVSRIQLAQTGCITVFMRGSRCWVAPDLRR